MVEKPPLTSIRDPRARYLRLKFIYQNAAGPKDAYETGRKELERGDFPTHNATEWFAILGNEPAFRFGDIGECIYCGAREFKKGTGLPLSEEHIIPEGLGARLILPFASCEECEKSTKRFEQVIIRDMLRPARRRMGVRAKKGRKTKPEVYKVPIIENGVESYIEVPLLEHPTSLMLPEFGLPELMTPLLGQSGAKGMWAVNLTPHDQMFAKGYKEFATLPLDTVCFCQLLSKIGHGLAVSRFGLSGFKPLLTPHIRANYKKEGEWLDRYKFIGQDQIGYARVPALHIFSFIWCTAPHTNYLVVRLRLFAHYPATPVYYVVVGELKKEQLPAIRDEGTVPSHTLDRSLFPIR